MLRWRSILISVGVRPDLAGCRILSHQNPNLQRAGKGKGFDTLPSVDLLMFHYKASIKMAPIIF